MTPPFRTPVLILFTVVAWLPGCTNDEPATQRVTIAGERFELDLALNDAQRTRGLMGVEHLDPNEGMLFVFPDLQPRRFWMKDCLIQIDVIFLDDRGRIVRMHTMDPPAPGTRDSDLRTYPSVYPARFAIELAGGRAEALGLSAGDQIDLPLERLKAMAR